MLSSELSTILNGPLPKKRFHNNARSRLLQTTPKISYLTSACTQIYLLQTYVCKNCIHVSMQKKQLLISKLVYKGQERIGVYIVISHNVAYMQAKENLAYDAGGSLQLNYILSFRHILPTETTVPYIYQHTLSWLVEINLGCFSYCCPTKKLWFINNLLY